MFWSGRINRATYWVCVGLIVALYLLFNLISSKQTAVSEVVLILVCVPRLHDIGKSGWWAGGFFLAEIVIAVISFATLPLKLATVPLGLFVVIVAGLMILAGRDRRRSVGQSLRRAAGAGRDVDASAQANADADGIFCFRFFWFCPSPPRLRRSGRRSRFIP